MVASFLGIQRRIGQCAYQDPVHVMVEGGKDEDGKIRAHLEVVKDDCPRRGCRIVIQIRHSCRHKICDHPSYAGDVRIPGYLSPVMLVKWIRPIANAQRRGQVGPLIRDYDTP